MGKKSTSECKNCKKKPKIVNELMLCKKCNSKPLSEVEYSKKGYKTQQNNVVLPTQ